MPAAFRYQHGDRPLDGFTIEHGVGRGGFGEVYYAVSDAGREVAIKAVQNFEEIELRGIRHCMNLKSPHLVSIFDVKHNDRNEPFVVMEFVSGPSLADLIQQHPHGLGTAKTAFFLREIAKGLSYLHDCGVVHRDLKPHNVFYEDGYVKIGDYSLSKMISTSHLTGHTMTVGTVHYMAPEISKGRYGTSIDIYALGVMLYEMLKGTPPFVGESMGEVLLKHVTEEPDLSGIDEPFASVVKKALAKDPDDRYQTAEEMVAAVFGTQHIENSVAAFNPQSLSVVAERVAERASPQPVPAAIPVAGFRGEFAATEAVGPPPLRPAQSPVQANIETNIGDTSTAPYHFGRLVGRIGTDSGLLDSKAAAYSQPARDPIGHPIRILMAIGCYLALVYVISQLLYVQRTGGQLLALILLLAAPIVSVLLTRAFLSADGLSAGSSLGPNRKAPQPGFHWRIVFLIAAVVPMIVVAMIIESVIQLSLPGRGHDMVGSLLALAALSVLSLTSPARPARVCILPVLTAFVIAAVVSIMWDNEEAASFSGAVAATMIMTLQVASPFDPQQSKRYKRRASWLDMILNIENSESSSNSPVVAEVVKPVTPPKKEHPVEPVVANSETSPRGRVVALVMCVLPFAFGFGGLQRFYVGRIGTGILWVCTWGLFGIGQLYDLIAILTGAFTDAEGRTLREWSSDHRSQSGERVNHLSRVPHSRRRYPSGTARRSFGGFFIGVALLIGMLLAIRLPDAAAAGLLSEFGSGWSPYELENLFSMSDWPKLVYKLGGMLAIALAFVGVSLFMFGRRSDGAGHMGRGIGGCFVLGSAIPILNAAFEHFDWHRVVERLNQDQFGPMAWEILKKDDFLAVMFAAFVLMFIGTWLVAWPPKKRTDDVSNQSNPSVDHSDAEDTDSAVVHS